MRRIKYRTYVFFDVSRLNKRLSKQSRGLSH